MKLFVCINAGLGNQVFQYLIARSLATDSDRQLIIDESYYRKTFHPTKKQGYYYPYLLDYFYKKLNKSNILQQFFIGVLKKSNKLQNIINILYISIFKRFRTFPIVVNDKNFPILREFPNKNVIMIGFFQSQPAIQKSDKLGFDNIIDLSETAKSWKEKINADFAIAVHVRRGDYIPQSGIDPYYAALSIDYYKRAINYIDHLNNSEDKKIYVFSDEPEWAKHNLNFKYPTEFINDSVTDIDQFYLQSICNANIISNSTFSYIPALLNSNKHKIVFAPSCWFHQAENEKNIFIPSTWVRIKN